tara:strand:+ start:1131 stop:1367 length:237 start_codon:yes stop_codon:yes gene_type:complete
MTLTATQLADLRDKFASLIVSDMSIETLEDMANECILEELNDLNEKQLVDKVEEYYDEDLLEDLIRSVTTTSTDNSLF